jgi:predicted MFS family arabinose efflux permease
MSDSSQPIGSMSAKTQPFSPSYVRYALWLLLIIYTLNFVDRQIVAILAKPIKDELGLTDTQLGLLTGIAFAFFYTLLGIPIARYAEKGNRATIIGTAVVVWSGFTAMSGLATNFLQLFLARIGVGVGEAGCTPPAHALISDYVSAEKRASAIAFYSLGVPIGTAFGFLIGAQLGANYGWRVAFLAVGLPGVLLGLLAMFTLKEPRKLGLVVASTGARSAGFSEALGVLSQKKSYIYCVIAATMISFLGYGHAVFMPQFYARVHHLDLKTIGTLSAITALVAGGLGTFLGGVMADRAARSDTRAYVTVPAIAFLAGVPFFFWGMTAQGPIANLFFYVGASTKIPAVIVTGMPVPIITVLALAVPTFLNAMWYGPLYAAVQGLAPVRMRATAVAMMLFVINMIGLGLGPLLIGIGSDIFAKQLFVGPTPDIGFATYCAKGVASATSAACLTASAEGLRKAIIWSVVVGIIALWAFWMARKTIVQDLADTAAEAKTA